jgi:hypothetical protein
MHRQGRRGKWQNISGVAGMSELTSKKLDIDAIKHRHREDLGDLAKCPGLADDEAWRASADIRDLLAEVDSLQQQVRESIDLDEEVLQRKLDEAEAELERRQAKIMRLTHEPSVGPPFSFYRYRDGVRKAEGVKINRADTLEDAIQKAAKLADPGDVLVLRTTQPPSDGPTNDYRDQLYALLLRRGLHTQDESAEIAFGEGPQPKCDGQSCVHCEPEHGCSRPPPEASLIGQKRGERIAKAVDAARAPHEEQEDDLGARLADYELLVKQLEKFGGEADLVTHAIVALTDLLTVAKTAQPQPVAPLQVEVYIPAGLDTSKFEDVRIIQQSIQAALRAAASRPTKGVK